MKRVLPSPLVVKEEHQIEPPVGLLLSLLPQAQNIFGWDGDGHPVVQHALLGHLRIDDLEQSAKHTGFYCACFQFFLSKTLIDCWESGGLLPTVLSFLKAAEQNCWHGFGGGVAGPVFSFL